MNDIRNSVLTEIEAYLAATGMRSQKFGKSATGNPKFVWRLRTDQGVGLKAVERAKAFMRDNPPASGNGAG